MHVDGVIRIRRVGALGKQERAREGAHDYGNDPSKHGLAKHNTVDAAAAFEESHTSGGANLLGGRGRKKQRDVQFITKSRSYVESCLWKSATEIKKVTRRGGEVSYARLLADRQGCWKSQRVL